jgi:hypothetical protein
MYFPLRNCFQFELLCPPTDRRRIIDICFASGLEEGCWYCGERTRFAERRTTPQVLDQIAVALWLSNRRSPRPFAGECSIHVQHEWNGDRRTPKLDGIDIGCSQKRIVIYAMLYIRAPDEHVPLHPSIAPSHHLSDPLSKDSKCYCLRTTSAPSKL